MDVGTYKVKSSIADIISSYGTEKSSTTGSKSFNDVLANMANVYDAAEKTTQKTLNNANTNPFKASSFNFQDWCANLDTSFDMQMYTKTEPARSDEEILKDMVELAKKHARQGTIREQDKEYLDLMKEYISSVSPDREGVLNRSMNEIIGRTNQGEDYSIYSAFEQLNSQRADEKEEKKEPIDYFLEALKNRGNVNITRNGNYYEVIIDHGSGMKTSSTYDISGELLVRGMSGNNYSVGGDANGSITIADFKDDNGVRIATFSEAWGFHSSPTNEETERRQEIAAAYNASYDFTIGRYNPPPSKSETHEMYEKTYNELRRAVA
jgi:hypothetical protein